MTALLTDNLPLLAGAPNGIKKLRELILELAVRGKLVEQDASDEPASELLKRIAAEKSRLVAEGKIKAQSPSPKIPDGEQPYELPVGWEWKRFGEIFALEYGDNLPAPKRSNTGEYPVYGSNGVVGTHSEPFVRSQCVVVGRKGSAGALNLCLADGCCVTDVAYYCVPPTNLSLMYVFKLFHTLGLDSLGKGIKPGLNRNEAYALVVAIPPLAEQHRIVAKVDELMALCDRLEAQQADAASAHAQLVQALLTSLAQASDTADFAASWQRLAEHFHTLFSTEPSIDALKQTLLQLAVMGKLVPQDPTDEPASELLKRISAESQRLVAEGKLKKRKPLAENLEADSPYDIPGTWAWARLEDIAYVFSGNAFKSEDFQDTPGIKVIKITNAGVGELIKTEDYLPVGHGCEHESFRVLQDDLILALTRPYISTGLKVSRCPAEYDGALLNQRVASIRLSSEVDNEFGFLFFKSPIVLTIYQERFGNSGLQPNLKMSDVTSLLIPIPPGEEQRRIVAKVDQLMALCDQLKTQLSQARQLNQQLASTLVEQAVA
jgi:type I restriction enzyme S subunit